MFDKRRKRWAGVVQMLTQNICIIFVQCWTNVAGAVQMLYTCFVFAGSWPSYEDACNNHNRWQTINPRSTSRGGQVVATSPHVATEANISNV